MFANLYFETTSPESPYKRLLELDVLFSVIFHAVLYTIALYLFGYIFGIKFSKDIYVKFFVTMLILMVLGYPARLARVKELKRTLMGYELDEKTSRHIAVSILHNGYFRWFFLG